MASRRESIVRVRRAALAVLLGGALAGVWGSTTAALEAPAPLHLNAVIPYNQPKSNDSFETRELIYASGRRSGEGSLRCSHPLAGRRRCSGSVTLEAGQVDFAGVVPVDSTTYRLALSGGGGRWPRARGTAVLAFSRGGTRAAVTITFS